MSHFHKEAQSFLIGERMKKSITVFAILIVQLFAGALLANEFFTTPNEPTNLSKTSSILLPDFSTRSGEFVYMYNLSKAFFDEANYEKALAHIEATVVLESSNAWVYKLQGDILVASGDEQAAKAAYEKALEVPDAYEFLPVWANLVKISPEYYANLGLLYRDKAKEFKKDELANEAIRYLDLYPGGFFQDKVDAARNEMEIFLKRKKSEDRQKSQSMEVQRIELERQAELRDSRANFRKDRLRLAGVYFNSFIPSGDIVFTTDDRIDGEPLIDNEISLAYASGALNDFHLAGGYLYNKLILKGGLSFGKTNVGKGFDTDSVWSEQQQKFVLNSEEINSIRSIKFSADAYYNFYFTDPILLYAGGGVDFGRLTLETKDDRFDPEYIVGAGIGGGIMLHFDNFLFDLNLKMNPVGSSSGTVIGFGGMYKF